MITGAQRLSNIKTKCRIIANRSMRLWLAGEIDILPAWNMDAMIAREFDRVVSPSPPSIPEE